MVEDIEECNTRLHHNVGQLLVDLEDAVHAVERQHHGARNAGCRPTISAKSLAGMIDVGMGMVKLTQSSSLASMSREGFGIGLLP